MQFICLILFIFDFRYLVFYATDVVMVGHREEGYHMVIQTG